MNTAFKCDALVIGAGVIGLAVARALSLSGREVTVVEAARTVGTGVSSRSSEVIHAGIYYPLGSLKARLCVEGRNLLYRYCDARGVPYRRCGKLIVARVGQEAELRALARRAQENGVKLDVLTGPQARSLEPEVACDLALFSRHTGIVSSHDLMLALQGDAEAAGATFAFGTKALSGEVTSDGVEVTFDGTDDFRLRAQSLVICAGLSSPQLAHLIRGMRQEHTPKTYFAKGSYFALTRSAPFNRLVYPVPEPGGLGVHHTIDLAGRARFGPDVQWLDIENQSQIDYRVDPARADRFYEAIRRYWPSLRAGELVPDYSGVRPKLVPRGEPDGDFAIHDSNVHGARGVVALYGIESPGLTSALAIGDYVADLVNRS